MKNLLLFLLYFNLLNQVQAQQTGSIQATVPFPKSGVENEYIYTPPKGIELPKKLRASVIYFNKEYSKKKIILIKEGDKFKFKFKAPDSTNVLVIAITEFYNNVIDNNKEKGYISYLYDKKGKLFSSTKVIEANLLSNGRTAYYHKIKYPSSELIRMYKEGFKVNPELKEGDFYLNYLYLLYKEKPDSTKPQLIAFAKQMLEKKGNEERWINAMRVYSILQMPEQSAAVEAKIKENFPQGEIAKNSFWKEQPKSKDLTEMLVLNAMEDYKHRFKDSSSKTMDGFYEMLINISAKNKNWNNVFKYAGLIDDQLKVASIYNPIAWDLTGGGLEGTATDLEFAKTISKLSVDIVNQKIKEHFIPEDPDDLVGAYIYYADTYALILYKLNKVDSAFYYQNTILEKDPMDVNQNERYSVYTEKAKGAAFAKDFIEPQLLQGANSPIMLKQLQSIYKQLNLPEEKFLKVKRLNAASVSNKAREEIIKRFGTQKAPVFTLKDTDGKHVSMKSLLGKVVILDFWATWCGPCRASFPDMQKLVNSYKDDNSVAFLFIDVWEHKNFKDMQQNAIKFIKDNNYSFHVLLDEKDKVIGDYKVEGIPEKFVIDKKGNMVYRGEGGAAFSLIIEAAKEN